MVELMVALGHLGVVAILGGIGGILFRKDFQWKWFVGALLLYLFYDFLLTGGFYFFPNPISNLDWNWFGKLLSISGMLGIAAWHVFGFERSGITFRQKSGSRSAYAVLFALCAVLSYFAISDGQGPSDPETIAFQWTMPGLDEELFYRGVLLLAMNEAFRKRWNILGASIGYGGLLTAILFGLAHAMSFENGGYDFDMMTFAITGIPSLILLWIREKTGSILLPIIGHNFANGIFTII
ncbi:CPBP family intramembrane glutamic endopeptidase, BDIM_20840 family [Parasphingorhabdus halotolerans]|uniref:CPBP family intramembrane metalloprotease n=1 Tax=Parasphingorhabdus halotolerans TaxID=2725558 RepID=A0A6H2DL30_9SPHN|nr:CPBP family intramembrane glutamic endopeptidase [Parasphingorhabdus halotolerans]QJB69369.1 CPBP family intramembrane metalloprotease [Parasphingorhabdus halotolerans]